MMDEQKEGQTPCYILYFLAWGINISKNGTHIQPNVCIKVTPENLNLYALFTNEKNETAL